MAYEQKPNSGVLFTNEKKTGKQPDLNGSFNIDGKEYFISAWVRHIGKCRYSLSVQPKTAKKTA